MSDERKFSTPRKLVDLEEVINTRTPVWDIDGSGDVRIKLDTDVNGQEWYVLSDDRNVEPLYGKVECWAFPHFNGAFDRYWYEPWCTWTAHSLYDAYPLIPVEQVLQIFAPSLLIVSRPALFQQES